MKHAALLCALLLAVGCRMTSDLNVVHGFELERYMGRWFEVARMPHGFEKNLSRVTADYSLRKDGSIRVLNKGYNDLTGQWESIEGTAKFRGSSDRGWLKVSFFKPFYASYKILHLNQDYTEAIVTGPTFGYLWILTRTPDVPEKNLQALITKAYAMGFDTNRLIRVSHQPIAE